jgi:hypothetical protein
MTAPATAITVNSRWIRKQARNASMKGLAEFQSG